MESITFIVDLTLQLANVLLHSAGLYILRCMNVHTKANIQLLYVMNLSVAELIINLFSLVRNILKTNLIGISNSVIFSRCMMYSHIVDYTVLKCNIYMTLVFILIDRLFRTLSSTYYKHWDFDKAWYLLAATWLVSFVICVTKVLCYTLTGERYQFFIINTYVMNISNIVFILIAVLSYSIILHNFKQATRRREKAKGIFKTFPRSSFYLPLFLIMSYICFTILADFTRFFCSPTIDDNIALLLHISYGISDFSHACLYIFMYGSVKRFVYKRLRHLFRYCISKPTASSDIQLQEMPKLLMESNGNEIEGCTSNLPGGENEATKQEDDGK